MDELFGAPARWGETLRTMLWTQTQAFVPAFRDSCVVDLPVACSFDFNVAITKYVAGLEAGEVPLAFQFSGSVFYRDEGGALQVARIAWDREARLALPVSAWREMIERYYPNSVWLHLPRDLFDRLNGYRLAQRLLNLEQGLESLLDRAERGTPQEAPRERERGAPHSGDRSAKAALAPTPPVVDFLDRPEAPCERERGPPHSGDRSAKAALVPTQPVVDFLGRPEAP